MAQYDEQKRRDLIDAGREAARRKEDEQPAPDDVANAEAQLGAAARNLDEETARAQEDAMRSGRMPEADEREAEGDEQQAA
ncbi:MAG: hypothetical protein FJ318_09930 [SAR202 cluster bacterium]|nr:hypothetical protein [SAR202 cluster bacterium]